MSILATARPSSVWTKPAKRPRDRAAAQAGHLAGGLPYAEVVVAVAKLKAARDMVHVGHPDQRRQLIWVTQHRRRVETLSAELLSDTGSTFPATVPYQILGHHMAYDPGAT